MHPILYTYYQKETKTHVSTFCYKINSQQHLNQSHEFQHIHSIRNKKKKKQLRGLAIYSPIPKKSVVLSFIPKSGHQEDHNFNDTHHHSFHPQRFTSLSPISSYSSSKVQKIK